MRWTYLVWDAIKQHPGWEADFAADLKVKNSDVRGGPSRNIDSIPART